MLPLMAYPREHRPRLASANTPEWVVAGIKRRAEVVGMVPQRRCGHAARGDAADEVDRRGSSHQGLHKGRKHDEGDHHGGSVVPMER